MQNLLLVSTIMINICYSMQLAIPVALPLIQADQITSISQLHQCYVRNITYSAFLNLHNRLLPTSAPGLQLTAYEAIFEQLFDKAQEQGNEKFMNDVRIQTIIDGARTTQEIIDGLDGASDFHLYVLAADNYNDLIKQSGQKSSGIELLVTICANQQIWDQINTRNMWMFLEPIIEFSNHPQMKRREFVLTKWLAIAFRSENRFAVNRISDIIAENRIQIN